MTARFTYSAIGQGFTPAHPELADPSAARTDQPASGRRRKKKKRSLPAKIVAFFTAVTGPRVDQATFDRRLALCRSGKCGHLMRHKGGEYCGACGCGKWRLAELSKKLWFARLECPNEPPLWKAASITK